MTAINTALTKAQLRKRLRSARQDLTPQQRRDAARGCLEQLSGLHYWQQSQRIAIYLSMNEELDTSPIVDLAQSQGKSLFLPVISNKTMQFAKWERDQPLESGPFGIKQPLPPANSCKPNALDLILLPLVAFDRAGNRLGMGAGYYDRYLADIGQQPGQPFLMGIAHSVQEVEELPVDPWDVALDGVITEQEVVLSNGRY